MRIALAQMNATVGDLEGNAGKILAAYGRASDAGADVVVFPELALTGYPPEDLLLRRDFLEAASKTLDALAADLKGEAAALIGAPHIEEGQLYNACAVVQKGRVAGWYHKMSLPNYGVFDEKRYFSAGKRPSLISVGGACLAVNICEDSWDPEGPYHQQLEGGGGAVVNLSASPYHRGKSGERVKAMAAIATKYKAPFAYCNLTGGQDELVFDGGSFMLDASGEVRSSLALFAEDILLSDVRVEENAAARAGGLPVITVEEAAGGKPDLEERGPQPRPGEEAEVFSALVTGTRDYLAKNGFDKALVGVSGGIDSALTLAVAVEALGGGNVTGVSMPGPYSSAETQADAEAVCRGLGAGYMKTAIGSLFAPAHELIQAALGGRPDDLTEQNLQARLRGLILMTLSNATGALVLVTGNKSETATGYCTLYGDTAGGFAPLKDVPKTLVWRLARYCNESKGKQAIPESIIARVPSAELRPGQKDSDTLPEYSVLDAILDAYIEKGLSIEEMAAQGLPRGEVVRTLDMIDRSEYKRCQAPPGIKITPRAFGKDWRRPISNRYRAGGR